MRSNSLLAAALAGLLATAPVAAADNALAVQQFLADKGCDPGTVDGQWGGGSRRAATRFAEITGVSVDENTDIPGLPKKLIEADCSTDISLAAPDQRPKYTTPADLLDLPLGLQQHNWIPAALRDFPWEASSAPFIDLEARAAAFTAQQKIQLGCNADDIGRAAMVSSNMRQIDRTYEAMEEGEFLTQLGTTLLSSFCTNSLTPLRASLNLLTMWAAEDAFTDLGLREKVREQHLSLVARPAQKLGQSKLNSTVLVFRETLGDFLVAWTVVKSRFDLKPEQIETVESWLGRMVEAQHLAFSESPLDCPSFDKLVSPIPRQLNAGKHMRWDQFEECINVGTSRAGVSALWAHISGDRGYAQDALNTYAMTLNLLRNDGSHIQESSREEIAHYKLVYNLAWMLVVAEIFALHDIDLYALEIDGRTMLTAAEFLARSAVDRDMIEHYAKARGAAQEPVEFKDPWHWIILNRFPDSKAAQLIKREFAGTADREEVFYKPFNVFKRRSETQYERDALLPFTMFFAPTDYYDYAPADVRAKMPG